MRRSLLGRSVLLTGASRGIGRRVAKRLAQLGANLLVTARSSNELESLVQEIQASGGTAESLSVDLTDSIQRELLVQSVVERNGGLDILINCAGVASFGEFSSSTPEVLRHLMEINFFVPSELIRLCQPYLAQSAVLGRQPAVVNVASICGRAGIPSFPEHCASKHALVGLTEALRSEFARYDIDILLVLPGLVKTDDMNRHLLRNEGRIDLDYGKAETPDNVADGVVKSLLRNTRERATGWLGWWVWFGRRTWPRGIRWIMRRKVQKFAEREAAGTPA
jgi:short-subunit dehydrogenase